MPVLTTPRVALRELVEDDPPFIHQEDRQPPRAKRGGCAEVQSEWPVASHAAHGFGLWLVELVATAEPIGMWRLLKRGALADPDIGFESLPHRQFSPRIH